MTLKEFILNRLPSFSHAEIQVDSFLDEQGLNPSALYTGKSENLIRALIECYRILIVAFGNVKEGEITVSIDVKFYKDEIKRLSKQYLPSDEYPDGLDIINAGGFY